MNKTKDGNTLNQNKKQAVTFSEALVMQQGKNCELQENAATAEESTSSTPTSWAWTRKQRRVLGRI